LHFKPSPFQGRAGKPAQVGVIVDDQDGHIRVEVACSHYQRAGGLSDVLSRFDVKLPTLPRIRHLERRSDAGGERAGALLNAEQDLVVVSRIVMGENQTSNARGGGQLYGICVGAVAPVFLRGILFRSVLRIMNDYVGAGHEFRVAPVSDMKNRGY